MQCIARHANWLDAVQLRAANRAALQATKTKMASPVLCAAQLLLHLVFVFATATSFVAGNALFMHGHSRSMSSGALNGLNSNLGARRTLQQRIEDEVNAEEGGGTITVVTTAAELEAAVQAGSAHIELREHISLAAVASEGLGPILSSLASTTKSIRVRDIVLFGSQHLC